MRRTAVFTALLVIVVTGIYVTAHGARVGPPSAAAAAASGAAGKVRSPGRELANLRTRTSKTFVTRDGSRVSRVFAESVHYRDARGRWQAIDSRLRRSGDRLVNRANRFRMSMPADLGRGRVELRSGRFALGFRLRGARAVARAAGADARYAEALPGVDVVYGARADGLKESLILRGPRSQRRFVFDLRPRGGIRPRLLGRRGLALVDARGRTRMAVPAPFMVDRRGRHSSRVRYALARVNGRWRLTMTADERWLRRPGRAWPVTVDPWVRARTDGDCFLESVNADTSYCGWTMLEVGQSGGEEHHSVLRFDVKGAVPKTADVEHAMLALYLRSAPETSNTTTIGAFPLTQGFTGAATWKRMDGVDRWAEAGGETDPRDFYAKTDLSGTTPAGAYKKIYVRKMVREWVRDERTNHGLLLKTISGGPNHFRFNSSECDSAPEQGGCTAPGEWANDGRPFLDVRYQPRVGEKRGWRFEQWQLSDRIAMKVNVATGNLVVRQTDFTMPGGLGPGVAVSRSYNSWERSERAFGRSWALDTAHSESLYTWGDDFVTYLAPSGAYYIFDGAEQSGRFKTPPGLDMTLKRDDAQADASKRFVLTEHQSQLKRYFDADGRLTAHEDRHGRRMTFTFAGPSWQDPVATIKDSQGDTVTFQTSDPQHVTQFTDPAGRVYSYGYDTSGRLTTATDPDGGVTRYEYNSACDKMSKLTTPGGRITLVQYVASTDPEYYCRVKSVTRVTDETNMTGPTWTFDYRIDEDDSGFTRVTDPIGTRSQDRNDRITRYEYDRDSQVTKVRDALRRTTSSKLTSTSKVESYTAASNSGTTPNTSFTYDGDDNQSGAKTPAGSGAITSSSDFGARDSDSTAPGTYSGVPSSVQGSAYLPGRTVNAQDQRTYLNWTNGTDTSGNLHGIQRMRRNPTTGTEEQVAQVSLNWGNGADGKGGQLNGITDGRGNATSYGYDAKGNVSTITPPSPAGPTRITYHAGLARVEKVQDGKDNWRLLTYDPLDRVKRIDFTGADQVLGSTEPYVEYTYDKDGNLTQEVTREQGTGTVRTRTITYDKLGRVTFESLPGGASNTYTYDLVGNLTSLTDAGGKVEYSYNDANELRSVYEPGVAKPSKFEHDKDGLRTKTTYANGVVIDQVYDSAQRLTEIHAKDAAGATAQRFNYAYRDPAGSRETPMIFEKVDGKLGQTTRYAYDGLDRLDTATIKSSTGDWATNGTLAKYDYDLDAAGNVVKRSVSGSQAPNATTDFGYNAFNQLCAQQAGTALSTPPACPTTSPAFTYDKNGNELTAPGRTSSYDLADHTTMLGGVAMVYLGTGQDRKAGEGSATLQHNVLGLGRRTSGTSTDYFTRDEGGKLVSRRNGTDRVYYFFDALGSVTGHTDASGAVISRRDYEPYGTPAPSGTGQWGAATGAGDIGQGQFGFAGGYRTTGGLYHFGQRYYDPSLMRWTQPDPLDQTGDLRQGNRYVYASGDPVNLSDPNGDWVPAAIAVGATLVRVAAPLAAKAAGRAVASRVGQVAASRAGQAVGRNSESARIAGEVAVRAPETVRKAGEIASRVVDSIF